MRLPHLLLFAACLSLCGCVAVAAGAAAGYGTAQYVRNADARDYAAPFPVVWSATVESMREAGFPVAPDATPAGNVGRLALNDTVVDVQQVSETTTRVRVRVGTFSTDAHRATAAAIHGGIARRMPPR